MKYWAYVNNEILGPFEKGKLLELPSFAPSLLVCPQTPVGEKTEDWKEASSYPELSALIGQGSQAPASAFSEAAAVPKAEEAQAPAAEPLKQSFGESPALNFKPLTSSKSLEPVPPAENLSGMMEITVNRLGKAGAGPAAAQPQQSSSSFDPISLSRIERRSETLSGQNSAGPDSAEGIALEPHQTFPHPEEKAPPLMPKAEAEPFSFTPAAEPPATPEIETFSRPAASSPAAAESVADVAGLENLIRRLDALSKAAATRQDINSAIDPLKLKLDQMGEVISSIKNSQFQREVMDKLVYLENSLGDLKTAFRNPQSAATPKSQTMEMEKNSDTVFGVQPVRPAEKPKAEAVKEPAKQTEITDKGSQPSMIGPALIKVSKLALTLVLLVAVLLGGVIGMKNFGVFDATKFIPFRLPFTGAGSAQPAQAVQPQPSAGTPTQAASQPTAMEQTQPPMQPGQAEASQPTPEQQTEQRQAMMEKVLQEQTPKKAMQKGVATEIIYITRTYKLKPGGQSLENMIYEHAGKAGGNYNRTGWDVKQAEEGMFEIAAVIPAKAQNLTYTFLVDRANKTVLPSNDEGKAVFDALSKETAKKLTPKKSRQKSTVKAAPRPQVKKAAPKKQAEPEEEYEYVEEDGTEQ